MIIISLWNGEKVLDLQRKVSIMKGMLKKHSNIRCHAYIYDVAIGSARELAPSEILSADSTDYRLGGSLTLRNGRVDKLQFEEGYCQAAAYSGNTSQDNFTFHYYDRDHLGNIREVINAFGSTKGTVIQTMTTTRSAQSSATAPRQARCSQESTTARSWTRCTG